QELTNLTKDQIIYLIRKLVELDQTVDIVIIDTGAGIADSVLEFVAASSEILLIATPEPTSITDAYALLKTLNRKSEFSVDDTVIKMIANRVTPDEDGEEIYEKLSIVVTRFLKLKLEYLGHIPVDNTVSKAVMRQKPAICDYPNSSFSKLITSFAKQLCDTEPEIQQGKKGIAQLFSNLLKSRIKK
ncbi:MAG: MinD/ParA family protein, partial [Anaerolineaceae bacterium]